MRERGMVFSAPEVRALLDGTKTQARRMVVPTRKQGTWLDVDHLHASPCLTLARWDDRLGAQAEHPRGGPLTWVACPYGAPGDALWVRETWWHGPQPDRAEYDADFDEAATEAASFYGAKKRSASSMPRWASRISLEITDVRVERLQDISEADARAEGVALPTDYDRGREPTYRHHFAALWDSVTPSARWAANPWVWALTFKRVEER